MLTYLAKEGYDPKFGARPLRRVIQSKILTPIANQMVNEGMLRGGSVKVDAKKGELTFAVKKKKGRSTPKSAQKKRARATVSA